MFYSTFTHSILFIFEKPQKYLLIIIKLLKMDILERKYSLLYHSIIIAKFEEQYLKEFSVVSQRAKASHVIKIAYFNGNFIRYMSGIFDTQGKEKLKFHIFLLIITFGERCWREDNLNRKSECRRFSRILSHDFIRLREEKVYETKSDNS